MSPALAPLAQPLLQIDLTAEQERQFDLYARLLAEWNTHTNLTAIITPDEVYVRHFLDSLTIVKATPLPPSARVIDVGSGAGFPGLPLAIAFPHLHVTLLEATGKKINFLNHVIEQLGVTNATTLNARAEDAGHLPEQRAQYDAVLARAVARLPSLLEYLLPLAKVGGRCIAMKGRTAHEESQDAARALTLLGGRLLDIVTLQLPGVEEPHALVVVEKTAHTPHAFPRKPGIPTRKPLV